MPRRLFRCHFLQASLLRLALPMKAYRVASTQWPLLSGMLFSASPSRFTSYCMALTSRTRLGDRCRSITRDDHYEQSTLDMLFAIAANLSRYLSEKPVAICDDLPETFCDFLA